KTFTGAGHSRTPRHDRADRVDSHVRQIPGHTRLEIPAEDARSIPLVTEVDVRRKRPVRPRPGDERLNGRRAGAEEVPLRTGREAEIDAEGHAVFLAPLHRLLQPHGDIAESARVPGRGEQATVSDAVVDSPEEMNLRYRGAD